MKKHLRLGLTALFFALSGANASAQKPAEARHADHEELRGLLKIFSEAFNARNFDALAPSLSKDFSIT